MIHHSVRWLLIFSMAVTGSLLTTQQAKAGPLLDWLLGRHRHGCYRPTMPVAPACGTCTTTCQQTCQRVVVNYVPYTDYRTEWEQVPVTQYRQTSSTDPCTGCTTTCMRPCTTSTWRMKRVPYTTYRPVYHTEAYTVPVTYTSPAPSTGCTTCGVNNLQMMPGGYTQSPGTVVDPNTINVNGSFQPSNQPTPAIQGGFNGSVPADVQPSLNSSSVQGPTNRIMASSVNVPPTQVPVRPAIRPEGQQWLVTPKAETMEDPEPGKRWNENSAPALLNDDSYTVMTPAIQKWTYTPVKLASYATTSESETKPAPIENQVPTNQPNRRLSPGWKSVQW